MLPSLCLSCFLALQRYHYGLRASASIIPVYLPAHVRAKLNQRFTHHCNHDPPIDLLLVTSLTRSQTHGIDAAALKH
jgi:hypothetical protein